MAYMVEHIDWYSCCVPAGVVPLNQDGEVQQFQLLGRIDTHPPNLGSESLRRQTVAAKPRWPTTCDHRPVTT